MSFQGEQFDGSVGRAWTHLPWTHQIYSCIRNNPVWKITKNWLSSSSTEGHKAHGDRQDKNCSLAKNPPLAVIHRWEGPHKAVYPWGARGSSAPSSTPIPGSCTRETSIQMSGYEHHESLPPGDGRGCGKLTLYSWRAPWQTHCPWDQVQKQQVEKHLVHL